MITQKEQLTKINEARNAKEIKALPFLDELYHENTPAFVAYVTDIYDNLIKKTQFQSPDYTQIRSLVEILNRLTSVKYQKQPFLFSAQNCESTTLISIFENDKYGLFANTLLQNSIIKNKLLSHKDKESEKNGLQLVEEQLHENFEALQTPSSPYSRAIQRLYTDPNISLFTESRRPPHETMAQLLFQHWEETLTPTPEENTQLLKDITTDPSGFFAKIAFASDNFVTNIPPLQLVDCATTIYAQMLQKYAESKLQLSTSASSDQSLFVVTSLKNALFALTINLKIFVQSAQQHDSNTLRQILTRDKYGLFSRALLKDPAIIKKLDMNFAREIFQTHIFEILTSNINHTIHDMLQTNALSGEFNPFTNLVTVSTLQKDLCLTKELPQTNALNFVDYVITTCESRLAENDNITIRLYLTQILRILTSEEYQKNFVESARTYDAGTLKSILEKDKYGFFTKALLEDSKIRVTLGEKGITFAKQQYCKHFTALQQQESVDHKIQTLRDIGALKGGLDPIANWMAVSKLKLIVPEKTKWYEFLGLRRFAHPLANFITEHFSWWKWLNKKGSYNSIIKLATGQTLYVGRHPTEAMIQKLQVVSDNAQPAKKRILALSFQGPQEGFNEDGTLKTVGGNQLITGASVPAPSDSLEVVRMNFPIVDHSMISYKTGFLVTPQEIVDFVASVKTTLSEAATPFDIIYAHCTGGVARSAAMTSLIMSSCNDMTLSEAFDQITANRATKTFESLKKDQADIVIRTYFRVLASDPAQMAKLTSKKPAEIAKHLKWYLESAQIDGTNNEDFLSVARQLAAPTAGSDQNKLTQILGILLLAPDKKCRLNKKGMKQLMEIINSKQPESFNASKPTKMISPEEMAILLAPPSVSTPETTQPKAPKTPLGIDKTTAELFRLLAASPTPMEMTPFDETGVHVQQIFTTGEHALANTICLISVALNEDQSLQPENFHQIRNWLTTLKEAGTSGKIFVKNRSDIYLASLGTDNNEVKLTQIIQNHPELEQFFPATGKMQQYKVTAQPNLTNDDAIHPQMIKLDK